MTRSTNKILQGTKSGPAWGSVSSLRGMKPGRIRSSNSRGFAEVRANTHGLQPDICNDDLYIDEICAYVNEEQDLSEAVDLTWQKDGKNANADEDRAGGPENPAEGKRKIIYQGGSGAGYGFFFMMIAGCLLSDFMCLNLVDLFWIAFLGGRAPRRSRAFWCHVSDCPRVFKKFLKLSTLQGHCDKEHKHLDITCKEDRYFTFVHRYFTFVHRYFTFVHFVGQTLKCCNNNTDFGWNGCVSNGVLCWSFQIS